MLVIPHDRARRDHWLHHVRNHLLDCHKTPVPEPAAASVAAISAQEEVSATPPAASLAESRNRSTNGAAVKAAAPNAPSTALRAESAGSEASASSSSVITPPDAPAASSQQTQIVTLSKTYDRILIGHDDSAEDVMEALADLRAHLFTQPKCVAAGDLPLIHLSIATLEVYGREWTSHLKQADLASELLRSVLSFAQDVSEADGVDRLCVLVKQFAPMATQMIFPWLLPEWRLHAAELLSEFEILVAVEPALVGPVAASANAVCFWALRGADILPRQLYGEDGYLFRSHIRSRIDRPLHPATQH